MEGNRKSQEQIDGMNFEEIEAEVARFLKEIGVVFAAAFQGSREVVEGEHKYEQDHFHAVFSKGKVAEKFNWFQGEGHRVLSVPGNIMTLPTKWRAKKHLLVTRRETQIRKLVRGKYVYHPGYWVIGPSPAGVLHCLVMDATFGQETFESFCQELGMNTDSIKDRETYFECQRTHDKLRKLFTHEQREYLQSLLQNY